MYFIPHLNNWVKGDILQGKWMIAIAVFILIPICILFYKSSYSLQKGMVIPLFLLLVVNIGYGGYMLSSRPKYVENIENQFRLVPQITIENELIKIKTDDRSYTMIKYVWVGLLIISVSCFLIFDKDFHQGLAIGFVLMFLGLLLNDLFLHQRLKSYLSAILEI